MPHGLKTTTFTDEQGLEVIVNNAEITQFVLGQDFADAYGDTLPDYFMKDFFVHSAETTIDCDVSVLDKNVSIVGEHCFQNMFYNCANLTTLPEGFNLPRNIITVGNNFAYNMFHYCGRLVNLPEVLTYHMVSLLWGMILQVICFHIAQI